MARRLQPDGDNNKSARDCSKPWRIRGRRARW